MYWLGQTLGLISTGLGIVTPVFKKKWQMLAVNICGNLILALNLIFLDRIGSGIFMFLLAAVQGTVSLIHTLRETKPHPAENTIFLILYLVLGFYGLVTAPGFVPAVNPQNLLELLPIIGAVLSMCFLTTREEKRARAFYIVCCSVWVVYYIFILSTAVFGSLLSVITGILAAIRDRREKPSA